MSIYSLLKKAATTAKKAVTKAVKKITKTPSPKKPTLSIKKPTPKLPSPKPKSSSMVSNVITTMNAVNRLATTAINGPTKKIPTLQDRTQTIFNSNRISDNILRRPNLLPKPQETKKLPKLSLSESVGQLAKSMTLTSGSINTWKDQEQWKMARQMPNLDMLDLEIALFRRPEMIHKDVLDKLRDPSGNYPFAYKTAKEGIAGKEFARHVFITGDVYQASVLFPEQSPVLKKYGDMLSGALSEERIEQAKTHNYSAVSRWIDDNYVEKIIDNPKLPGQKRVVYEPRFEKKIMQAPPWLTPEEAQAWYTMDAFGKESTFLQKKSKEARDKEAKKKESYLANFDSETQVNSFGDAVIQATHGIFKNLSNPTTLKNAWASDQLSSLYTGPMKMAAKNWYDHILQHAYRPIKDGYRKIAFVNFMGSLIDNLDMPTRGLKGLTRRSTEADNPDSPYYFIYSGGADTQESYNFAKTYKERRTKKTNIRARTKMSSNHTVNGDPYLTKFANEEYFKYEKERDAYKSNHTLQDIKYSLTTLNSPEYNTGKLSADLIYELLSDPTLLIGISAGLIKGGTTASLKQSTKQIAKSVAEETGTKLTKKLSKGFIKDVLNNPRLTDKQIQNLLKVTVIQPMKSSGATKEVTESVYNQLYRTIKEWRHSYNYKIYESAKKLQKPADIVDLSLLGVSMPAAAFGMGAYTGVRKIYNRTEFVSRRARKKIFDSNTLKTFLGYDTIDNYYKEVPLDVITKDKAFADEVSRSLLYNINELDKVRMNIDDIANLESAINQKVFELTEGACSTLDEFVLQQHPLLTVTNSKELAQLKYFQDTIRASQAIGMVPQSLLGTKSEILVKNYNTVSEFLEDLNKHNIDQNYFGKINTLDDITNFQEQAKLRQSVEQTNASFINLLSESDLELVEYFNRHKLNDEGILFFKNNKEYPELRSVEDVQKYYDLDVIDAERLLTSYVNNNTFLKELRVQRQITDELLAKGAITEDQYALRIHSFQNHIDNISNDSTTYNILKTLDAYDEPLLDFIHFNDDLIEYINMHNKMPRLKSEQDINKYFIFDYDAEAVKAFDWPSLGFTSEDEFQDALTDKAVKKLLQDTDLNHLVDPFQHLIDSGYPTDNPLKALKDIYNDPEARNVFNTSNTLLRANEVSSEFNLPKNDFLNDFEKTTFKKEPSVDELIDGSKKGTLDKFIEGLPGVTHELNRQRDYDIFVKIRDVFDKFTDTFPGVATKRPFDHINKPFMKRSAANLEVDELPPYRGLESLEGDDLLDDVLYSGRTADMDDIDSMFTRIPSFLQDISSAIQHAELNGSFTDAHIKILFGSPDSTFATLKGLPYMKDFEVLPTIKDLQLRMQNPNLIDKVNSKLTPKELTDLSELNVHKVYSQENILSEIKYFEKQKESLYDPMSTRPKERIDHASLYKKATPDQIEALKLMHEEITDIFNMLPSKYEYDFTKDYIVFKVNSQDKVESFINDPTYSNVVQSVLGNGPAKYDLDYIREGALYYDDRILDMSDVSDIKNHNYFNNCKEFYENIQLSEIYNTMRTSIKNDPNMSTLVKLSLLDSLAKRGRHTVDDIIENMNINLLVQGGKRVSLDSFRAKRFADDIAKLPESKKQIYKDKVAYLCEGGHTDPMDDIIMQEFVMRRHNPSSFKEDTLLLDIETTGNNAKAHSIFSVAYYNVKGGQDFKNFEELVDYMYSKKLNKDYSGKTINVKYTADNAKAYGPPEDVARVFYDADKKATSREQWLETYTLKEGELEFNEADLLEELLEELTFNRRVATYNMNGYDLKFISDRLDFHKFSNPTNRLIDVDGMAFVKRGLNVEYVTNSDRRLIKDYVEQIDQLFGDRGFSPMSPTDMHYKLNALEKEYMDIAKIDPTVRSTSTRYVLDGDTVIRQSRYDDAGDVMLPQSSEAVSDLKVLADSYRQEHVLMETQVHENIFQSGILPDYYKDLADAVGEHPSLANILRNISKDGELEYAYKNFFKGSTVGLIFDADKAYLSQAEARLLNKFSTQVLKTRDTFLYLPSDAAKHVEDLKEIIHQVNKEEIFPVKLLVPDDTSTLYALTSQIDYYRKLKTRVDFSDDLAKKIETTVDKFKSYTRQDSYRSATVEINQELRKLKQGESSLSALSRVFDNTGNFVSEAFAMIAACRPLDEALQLIKNMKPDEYTTYVKTSKAYHDDIAEHQARSVANILTAGTEEDVINFLYYYAPVTTLPKRYVVGDIVPSQMYNVQVTDTHYIVYLNKNFDGKVTSQKYFKSYKSKNMFNQPNMKPIKEAIEESNASIARFAGPGYNASTGVVLSSQTLERKILKLPTSVQMNMWDLYKVISPDKFTNLRFDFTTLGKADEIYDFKMNVMQDPLLNNTTAMKKLMSGQESATQYMMIYTGSHDTLGVKNIFPSTYTTKEIIQALNDSPEYIVAYVTKSKSKYGFKMEHMSITNEADLALAETRKAIIIPYGIYEQSFTKLNSLPIQHPFLKKIITSIYTFKASNLTMPSTWHNNAMDSAMKGGMNTVDYRYMINLMKSHFVVRDYNNMLKAMVKYTGEQNIPPTKLREAFDMLSKTQKTRIDFEQFEVLHGLLNGTIVAGEASRLARELAIQRHSSKILKVDDIVNEEGAIVKHLKFTDYTKVKEAAKKHCKTAGIDLEAFMAYVFKPNDFVRKSVNPKMHKVYDRVAKDLFVPRVKRITRGGHYGLQRGLNFLLTPMGAVESRVRVAHLLTLSDQGVNKTSILNRISKTHFNYNMKSTKMKYLEMAVPFAFFEINNMNWWLNMAKTKPGVVKMTLRTQNEVGFNAWDYDNEELASNNSLLYAITAGNIPVTKWGFKYNLNLSYLSVMENIMDPFTSLNGKLLPPLQYAMTKFFEDRGGLLKSLMDESAYWGIDEGFFPTSMRDTFGAIRSARHLMNVATGDAFSRIPDNVANKNIYKLGIVSSLFSVTKRFDDPAHTFEQFQLQLLKQGKWYDANRGMVRPLSEISWTGLNKPNMTWDEIALARFRFGEIFDQNIRAFVPIGQWSPTMLNDPTISWEEVSKYRLSFFDEVWDNNVWNSKTNRPGRWVRSKDVTKGGLNDPNLTHEQRNALMMKIHKYRWDNNTGKYIPMEDWSATGLNEPDLSWNEFSKRMYEIRGLEWDNNKKKFVSAGTSTSGRYNPATGRYEWNKRTFRKKRYRRYNRRVYRRYSSAVRKFKQNRARQFTSQENKWFHYEHLKTSPSGRLVSKVFNQARNTHNYVTYNGYVSGIHAGQLDLKKYYHDFYSMPKMTQGMFAHQRMSIQKFLSIQSKITQARFRPNSQMSPKTWWWLR